jgi:hypothetical protein
MQSLMKSPDGLLASWPRPARPNTFRWACTVVIEEGAEPEIGSASENALHQFFGAH